MKVWLRLKNTLILTWLILLKLTGKAIPVLKSVFDIPFFI